MATPQNNTTGPPDNGTGGATSGQPQTNTLNSPAGRNNAAATSGNDAQSMSAGMLRETPKR